jgi:serine/threonine protein phosphatase PrpC
VSPAGPADTGGPGAAAAAAGPADGGPTDGGRESACSKCGAAIGADGYCEQCGRRRADERDHVEVELAGVSGVSDKGLRHHRNEDAMALTVVPAGAAAAAPTVVAVVCDGVSSSPHPEEASAAAAETGASALADALGAGEEPEAATLAAARRAAEAVAGLAPGAPGGSGAAAGRAARGGHAPACTYVSAVVSADTVTVGWVGDSRAYWLGSGREGVQPSTRLTRDDSWATYMVSLGVMSEEEAANSSRAHTLTGWLGADAEAVEVHHASFTPGGPGVLLVCSDGLWNYLPDATDLAAAVPDAAARPLAAAQKLVRTALDAGGRDNVTVAVIPFPPTVNPPDPSPDLPPEPPPVRQVE